MRAEDLFEAMDGLDEKLIARSDVKRKRSQKASEQKARKGGKNSRKKKKAADRMNRIPFVRLAAGAGEAPAGAFLSGVFDCIYLPRQNTDQVVYNVLCPRNYNAGFEKRIP